MKEIDGVNLEDLVKEVSKNIVSDRRESAAGLIKKQLQKMEGLAIDVSGLEKQLKKKKEALAKAQEKVTKIREGNWQVLAELDKQFNQKKEKE